MLVINRYDNIEVICLLGDPNAQVGDIKISGIIEELRVK